MGNELTPKPLAGPLSAEAIRQITRLANDLSMKDIPLPVLRHDLHGEYSTLIESIEYLLLASHGRRDLFLPDLTAFENQTIGIFSDYAGEGSGNYFVYSILICAFNVRANFHAQVREIREQFGLASKEIAYKDLRMGQMRRALPRYLAAADLIPGFLCTVAVDKHIKSVFQADDRDIKRLGALLEGEDLGTWKPAVAEKLLRVTHMAAYLVALLGSDGQKVFWMSDNDAICPTEHLHSKVLQVFSRLVSMYARPGCTFCKLGGAVPFVPRDIDFNDLLSLPDLAAGVFGDYLSKSETLPHDEITAKEGTETILPWLGHQGIGLKKFCAFIREAPNGSIERARVEISSRSSPTIPIPIYDNAGSESS